MRIVIDLQCCQNGAVHNRAAVLAQAQALAGNAGAHTVFIALSEQHADTLDELRHAFAGILPPDQVRSYPALAPHSAWERHAAEQLRAWALGALGADAVYVPGLGDGAPELAVYSPLPQTLNVAGAGDATALLAALAAGGGAHAARRQRQLAQADLLLAADAGQQRLLAAALAPLPVLAGDTATAASAAALLQAIAGRAAQRPAATAPAERPLLAFVSPLPPEQSGIADYSADLIAELEAHYRIELVPTPGAATGAALSRFPLRSTDYFEQHAAGYDRIVYHFGNSNMHKHMFGLLQRHPGMVVLHDFYLSGVLDNMERDGDQPGAFMQALYASHGHSGLQHHAEHGRNPTIWAFPCNKAVLDQAAGVVVHSDFSRQLAERWYGPGSADGWSTVPLLRRRADGQPTRETARAALGLHAQDYVVSSFGMLGSTKLNDRLLDAFLASPLAADPHCQLVFVGENDAGPYGYALRDKLAASGASARIRITGFVSAADYAHWLLASDAAVQLRAQTRGETSASVLDCLLYGLPTIINAHGAAADLPDAVLLKLADQFDTAALAAALARLHAEPALRARLAQAGSDYIASEHSPAQAGKLYRDAIEHHAAHSAPARYRALLAELARSGPTRAPDEAALMQVAAAIASHRAPGGQRQLLVDISALVQADFKTGIQRVVRSILLALIKRPPPGCRVEPVYSEGGMRPYRYARQFTATLLGAAAPLLDDAPIDAGAGDIFLGLDLASNITTQNEPLLRQMRRRGVAVWFVVYDLLPLLRPEAFAYGTEKYYGDYIDSITLTADGVLAISRSVSDELGDWLAARPNRRLAPLQLGWFHLGADLDASAPSSGLPDNAERVLAATRGAPTLLMVGTLEPRKGQLQTLEACELLWQGGAALNLVIVGKKGWLVDALVKRLESHPQRERQLFWLPDVSDEMLARLYADCTALLAASEGEGFGLPLIEAAQHGLPIIARDIPVFREVAGAHAYYFDGRAPAALAEAVAAWLALHAAGQAPRSTGMPWLSWEQSAQQLTDIVVHGRSQASYAAGEVAPQLLVDVSAVASDDLKTGIQRVVRAQLSELLRMPTRRFRVHPVYLSDAGGRWQYRYARRYEHQLLGTDSSGVVDGEVAVTAGDVFYSPDFFPGAVTEAANTGLYQRWRAAGVSVNFLIHDLLPVLRPDFFPSRTDSVFEEWLAAVSANADRLICISGAVADELRAWLAQHGGGRPPPELTVVHHGADIDASLPSKGMPDDAPAVLADIASAPSFVMVGTIEPRKGHLQALDAFEQLWAAGADVRLVVVGGEGWKGLPDARRRTIPAIVARLAGHPELGKRLHWLVGISDEYLEQVYRGAACLLVPSEGEGFGLPLIEAARHGLPVIARDIPVFREVAQQHAHYFSGSGGAELAAAVQAWLQLRAANRTVGSADMPWYTWAQNVETLTAQLFGAPPPPGETTI